GGGRHRLAARRGAPALGDRLSLVCRLGAALGRPVPAHRLARAVGAHPAELPRPAWRGAAHAVGVCRHLGAVRSAAGDGTPMAVRLIVSYRGAAYAGWQRQANALAVQEGLEDALARAGWGRGGGWCAPAAPTRGCTPGGRRPPSSRRRRWRAGRCAAWCTAPT